MRYGNLVRFYPVRFNSKQSPILSIPAEYQMQSESPRSAGLRLAEFGDEDVKVIIAKSEDDYIIKATLRLHF